jgi:hypothetical protein
VRMVLPRDATVVVISKGDEQLVALDVYRAWHFPQTEDGVYAGYYPVDSTTAIDHLEALRAKGSRFLLIPGTAFWWHDHYADFGRHLDTSYHRIWDDDTCMIYQFSDPGEDSTTPGQGAVRL